MIAVGHGGLKSSLQNIIPPYAVFLSRHVRFHRSLCNGPLIDGPYAALHARLGDRAGISLVNCSHFGFDFTAPKSWESKGMSAAERESIMFGCVKGRNLRHVDVITIEEAMKAWTLPSHIQTVYIATNRPSSSRISTIKEFLKARSLKPLLWEDLSMSLASARDGTAISIVEQCIALYSDAFLPGWPSTWDSTVIFRRMDNISGKEAADAHTQFELLKESLSRYYTNYFGLSNCWK